MIHDAKVQELVAKGKDVDSYFEDEDTSWMKGSSKDFKVLRDDHDEEDIARQLEALSNKEELKAAMERYKTAEEWNKFVEEGGQTAIKLDQERRLQENFEKAMEDAQQMNSFKSKPEKVTTESYNKLTNESVKNAIDLFNDDSEDDTYEEDDFYI